VFPELGEEIEKINRGDLFNTEVDGDGSADANREHTVRVALEAHASWLAESNNIDLSECDMSAVDAIARKRLSAFETMQEKRDAFREIEDYMADRYKLDIDAEAAKDSRRRAREDTDAVWSTALGSPSKPDTEAFDNPVTQNDEYFLDSEFVAIYW